MGKSFFEKPGEPEVPVKFSKRFWTFVVDLGLFMLLAVLWSTLLGLVIPNLINGGDIFLMLAAAVVLFVAITATVFIIIKGIKRL